MELKIIAFLLFIPTFILLAISFFILRKLAIKITGVKNVRDFKNPKDFVNKSLTGSDILLEVFFPKKYSKKYPAEFNKARLFLIPTLILFIPTIGLIFYDVFKSYPTNNKPSLPLAFIIFFILTCVLNVFLRKYRNKK